MTNQKNTLIIMCVKYCPTNHLTATMHWTYALCTNKLLQSYTESISRVLWQLMFLNLVFCAMTGFQRECSGLAPTASCSLQSALNILLFYVSYFMIICSFSIWNCNIPPFMQESPSSFSYTTISFYLSILHKYFL